MIQITSSIHTKLNYLFSLNILSEYYKFRPVEFESGHHNALYGEKCRLSKHKINAYSKVHNIVRIV